MLVRWDPMREMNALRRVMDRMWDEAVERRWSETETGASPLALDVVEDEGEFVVKASLPGMTADDIDITFTDGNLTIQGEIKKETSTEEATYHLTERFYGKLYRQIRLPAEVDADNIQAHFENGVLTLTLPKSEEVKPKRIAISSGEKHPMIEGKVKDIAHKN